MTRDLIRREAGFFFEILLKSLNRQAVLSPGRGKEKRNQGFGKRSSSQTFNTFWPDTYR